MSGIDISRFFANADANGIGNAFASRRAVLPWTDRQSISGNLIPAIWSGLMSRPGQSQGRLAYLHVPFCANHCLFCGFYRNAYTPASAAAYTDYLISEIEREASEPAVGHSCIEAVYLGGGTPSALSADELARILGVVRRSFVLAPDCEVTLEGRISHFDNDKIDACLEAGVNRISVGVQSFDTAVRRRQGRRTDTKEVIRFLAGIHDRGRAALVIDLLYGLPGQTAQVWLEDLRIATDLRPDGIDLYGLNLIPGTPLQQAVASGKMEKATLQSLASMYETGAAYLDERGWRQLSNSHWTSSSRERNLYNLRIKQGAECLAYGSGAGGSLGRYSYSIEGNLQRYGDIISAGRKPLAGIRVSDALALARHYVTAGFEIGLLDLRGLMVPNIPNITGFLTPLLEQWQRAGLLVREGDSVALTTAGRFWYGNLVTAFHDIISATPFTTDIRPDIRPSLANRAEEAGQMS